MGASGRSPNDRDFEKYLKIVRAVKALGLETCMTLGMLKEEQAQKLKEAGLDYYNHNLDTAPSRLRQHYFDKNLSGQAGYARPCPQGGHQGLLWRDYRNG